MRFRKSRPKCSRIHVSWKLLHIRYCGKSSPIVWATSVIFTKPSQRKQSHNRRKFAQSGLPAYNRTKELKYVVVYLCTQWKTI
jgi:hypothetical protein